MNEFIKDRINNAIENEKESAIDYITDIEKKLLYLSESVGRTRKKIQDNRYSLEFGIQTIMSDLLWAIPNLGTDNLIFKIANIRELQNSYIEELEKDEHSNGI